MVTATLSTRGQIVIPAEVRRAAGWQPGDRMAVVVSEDGSEVRLRKRETLDEIAARLSRYVKPGTPPLIDVHGFYEQREARV